MIWCDAGWFMVVLIRIYMVINIARNTSSISVLFFVFVFFVTIVCHAVTIDRPVI